MDILKKYKGFTLVELVIVIVIVGILSVISVPIYRGYVQKAKMTEGQVLVGSIVKAQLAFHVKYGEFRDCGGYVTYDRYIDMDASGNKYFKLFLVQANNNYPATKASVNKTVEERKLWAPAEDDYDTALIEAGYESPKGWVVVSMTVCSNGGCSDIRSYSEGYGGAPEDEQVEVAEQEEYYCK